MIEKSLAGPIGIFVKFSTLQDHGIDKVFFLENDNVDASQKNVIFLARGEKATQPIAIAGMYVLMFPRLSYLVFLLIRRYYTSSCTPESLYDGTKSRLPRLSHTLCNQS